jgi:hypothetical protein
MAATLTMLTGGAFQDSNGNPLSYGYLTLKLSQDGNVAGVGNVCSGVTITIQLDVNGNVGSSTSPTPVANQYVWANSNISPINTYYKVTGYTQEGQRAFGPNNQQVAAGATFNVGTWVPNSVISWFPEVSQNSALTLEVNGSLASSQTTQNLENSASVTVVDNGGGNISFTASSGGILFESDGNSLSGWTVVGGVTAGTATSGYAPKDFLETFYIPTAAYAYINTGISTFAGCVVEFDVAIGDAGSNGYLLFGCNASGAGPFFVSAQETYGNSGIGASSSWAYVGTTPGEVSSSGQNNQATQWFHVRIDISRSGGYATYYLNGAPQQQFAITLEGGYLGISSYSSSANIANIRVYNG